MHKKRLVQAIAIFSGMNTVSIGHAITITGNQSISGIETYASQFNGTGINTLSYQLLNPTQTLTLDDSRTWYGGNTGLGTNYPSDGTQWQNLSITGVGGQRELIITESTIDQVSSRELVPFNIQLKNVDIRFDEGQLHPRGRPGVTSESLFSMDNSKITFGGSWASLSSTGGTDHTIRFEMNSGVNAWVNYMPNSKFLNGSMNIAKGAEFSLVTPDFNRASSSPDYAINVNGGILRFIGNGNTATSGVNKRSEFTQNASGNGDINLYLDTGSNLELSGAIYTQFQDIYYTGSTVALSDSGTQLNAAVSRFVSGTTNISLESGTSISGSMTSLGGSYLIDGIDNASNVSFTTNYPSNFSGQANGSIVSHNQTLAVDAINVSQGFVLSIGEQDDYENGVGNTVVSQATSSGSWFISNSASLSGHIDASIGGLFLSIGGNFSPGVGKGDIGSMALTNTASAFSFQGATLEIELDPTASNSNLKNDKLTLTSAFGGNGDLQVNIDAKSGISATASDYDGESFEIVDTTGVTGSSMTYSFAKGASLPALVSFTETVNGANGYTLTASAPQAPTNPTPTQVAQVTTSITTHPTTQSKPNVQTLAPTVATHAVTSPTVSPTTQTQVAANAIHQQMQSVTNAQIGRYLNSFHPEPFASHQSINLEMAEYMANTVLKRSQHENQGGIHQGFAPQLFNQARDDRTNNNEMWADTSYIEGELDGQNNLAGASYYLGALTLGTSIFASEKHHFGVFAGANRQSMDEHDNTLLKFDTDGYQLGVYGGYQLGANYRASYVFGFGQMSTDSERTINVVNEQAKASFDTDILYTSFRLGRVIKDSKKFEIEPFAGLSYYQSKQGKISETGSSHDWNLEASTETATIASLGLEVSPSSDNDSSFQPSMTIRFDHDFDAGGDKAHEIKGSTISAPTTVMNFYGQGRGENLISTELGGLVMVSDTLHIGGGLSYSWAKEGTEKGLGLNLQWLW